MRTPHESMAECRCVSFRGLLVNKGLAFSRRPGKHIGQPTRSAWWPGGPSAWQAETVCPQSAGWAWVGG